jgi:hypothetical protein
VGGWVSEQVKKQASSWHPDASYETNASNVHLSHFYITYWMLIQMEENRSRVVNIMLTREEK